MTHGKHLPEQVSEANPPIQSYLNRKTVIGGKELPQTIPCMTPSGTAIACDFHLQTDIQTSRFLAPLHVAACKGRSLFQQMHTLNAGCTKLHKNTSFAQNQDKIISFVLFQSRAKNKARNESLLDNCAVPSTQEQGSQDRTSGHEQVLR